MSTFNCPYCSQQIHNDGSLAGRVITCPRCRSPIHVPQGHGPPPPPPFPSEQRSEEERAFSVIAASARRAFRAGIRRRFRPATSWFDLFDWKFEKYLTPWVVRATWIAYVIQAFLAVLVIAIFTLWAWLPEPKSAARSPRTTTNYEDRPTSRSTSSYQMPDWLTARILSTAVALAAICAILIGLLWIRVLLETAIVLFNIAITLNSIDEKTGGPGAPT
jgi:hypothetical protein